MNKQQLRNCFDKIRPREALIEMTLNRVHRQQTQAQFASVKDTSARPMSRLAFATRLASTACALALVIGMGIAMGKDAVTAPSVKTNDGGRSVTPMALTSADDEPAVRTPSVVGAFTGCEQMIAAAADYETDRAVFSATVEAVYFTNETEGIIVLYPETIAARQISANGPGWVSDDGTLAAHVVLTDADREMLLNSVGSCALVGIHAEQRETEMSWVVHEIYPENAFAE